MKQSLLDNIKNQNKKTAWKFVNTKRYWQKSPSNMLLLEGLTEALGKYVKKKHRLLDAGAGKLAYRSTVQQYTDHYLSSDFAKTHPELDVVTDIERMSFKKNTFDVVLCSQVLEHVPHPWKALAEIYRVLKPNGIGITTVPMLGYIHNAPYDFYRYTKYGLRSLATDAGFKVITIKELGGFFSFIGYIRSTLLMPFFKMPLIGDLLFWINIPFSKLDIALDKLSKSATVFPLNYIVIVKKASK